MANVEDAVKWAENIAKDNSHGYSQGGREGRDFDCSSLVCRSLRAAGFNAPYPSFSTRSMGAWLESHNWEWHNGVSGAKRGDIMWKTGHTAWATSTTKICEACIDENGNITGGKPGDQTGNEIRITNMNRYNWAGYWRYNGEKPKKNMSTAQIADVPNQSYTGKPVCPALHSAVNATFTTKYENNIHIGWGKAIATGKDDWVGTVEQQFKILPTQLVGFTDVNPDDWYIESLTEGVQLGYIKGYGGSTIGPNDATTRGQAVVMIARAEGADISAPFDDVQADDYYFESVEWAKESGIVSGDDGKFRPNDVCTREEFAVMLHNLAGKPEPVGEPSGYNDWDKVNEWAKPAMAWCVESGIISGNNNYLRPADKSTRAETNAMLLTYEKMGA